MAKGEVVTDVVVVHAWWVSWDGVKVPWGGVGSRAMVRSVSGVEPVTAG